jgi:hypothetical protein
MIIIILGPMALASSGLYFCTLSGTRMVGNTDIPVRDLGDAIRNVLNSTLLLIFGLSLAIWGFFVNRNRAWRLDGGTAVFGAGALVLAVVTTASSFVAVKEEGIPWLQHLIWAAVLWQTWLGWWWWVGAGMGIGEVEDIMERALRKRRKAARRAHRRDVINSHTHGNAQKKHLSAKDVVKNGTNAVVGFTSSLHHLVNSSGSHGSGGSETRRRRHADPDREPDVEEGLEGIELGSVRIQEPVRSEGSGSGSGGGAHPSSNSETSSTSRTPSLHPPKTLSELVAYPTTWLQVYFRRLRKEHEEAARRRAVEQAQRRSRVPAIHGGQQPRVLDEPSGWGLGAYGLREAEESTRRVQEANRQIRQEALLRANSKDSDASASEGEGDEPRRTHRHDSTRSARSARSRRESAERAERAERADRLERGGIVPDDELRGTASRRTEDTQFTHDTGASAETGDTELKTEDDEEVVGELVERPEERGQWEDISSDEEQGRERDRRRERERAINPGWSWWGPLREWRLVERNTY